MGKSTSRRSFLSNSLMATTSLAILGSTGIARAFTSDESPFQGYNPFAPFSSDLRTYPFGEHVAVIGNIYDEKGITPLSGVSVEVWHLSPNTKKYRHRAKLQTDNSGTYRFITDLPGREMGKNFKVYFKISKAELTYFTELSFNNSAAFISGKHWEKNHQLGEERLFPKHKTLLNTSTINFNISLNKL